jgi:hypothetical protein
VDISAVVIKGVPPTQPRWVCYISSVSSSPLHHGDGDESEQAQAGAVGCGYGVPVSDGLGYAGILR